jgi:hypothetical protein
VSAAHRHGEVVERLRAAVLESPGTLEPEVRRAIAAGSPPDALAGYLGKVERQAYTVRDDEVERLRAGGWSDDALFEATVSAALGAGLSRLEIGLAAISEAAR